MMPAASSSIAWSFIFQNSRSNSTLMLRNLTPKFQKWLVDLIAKAL